MGSDACLWPACGLSSSQDRIPFLIVLFNTRLHRASILSRSITPIIPNNCRAVGILTFRSSLNMMDRSVTDLLAVVPFLHICGRTGTRSSRPYTVLCPVDRGIFAHFNAPYRNLEFLFCASSWKSRSFFWLEHVSRSDFDLLAPSPYQKIMCISLQNHTQKNLLMEYIFNF